MYSESKKTYASVTLEGAREVINLRERGGRGVEPTTSWPSGVICNVFSGIKIIYRNKVQISSR